MTPETGLQPTVPTAEPSHSEGGANGISPPHAALPDLAASPPVTPALRRWLFVGAAVLALLVGGVGLYFGVRAISARTAANGESRGNGSGGIPVNTVLPHKKTLVRTLEQPGSIEPFAKVELYSRASGYLKLVARDPNPQLAVDLLARKLSILSAAPGMPALALAADLAVATELSLWEAPEKDYGSFVHAGELLLVIDAPELRQEIAQKDATWKQRVAELEAARTALATFQAQLLAVEAQLKQAEADVKRAASDHAYYAKQLARLRELVRRETIAPEVADEKLHQVEAAQAAWDSSQAKLLAVQAERGVVASKQATAKSDLLVREAQVHVAIEDLHRSEIQASYANIYAPCDGVITYRDVDEGDFVQNSTSGSTRRLMTVAAIDKVKVVLQVPERDATWVRPGAEATVLVDARVGWAVKGRVARIAHALDSQSRTMRVEIDLPNPDRRLKPGMYGQVALTLQEIENSQVIPATAVYSRGGENFIIVVNDGLARRQLVHITYDDGHEVAVVKLVKGKEVPLQGTEEVVVSNKGELRDGQHVRATRQSGN